MTTRHLTFATGSQPGGTWACETVQRHADDVVLAAGMFKPNAPGRFCLSPSGFGDRQLLTARGAVLGERLLLGVTPLDLYAIDLILGGRLGRLVARWSRDDLVVQMVAAKRGRRDAADPLWPALLISLRTGIPSAEVQVVERDSDSERLVALLLTGRSIFEDGPEPD
jgi:hypothetical protein